MTKVKIDKDACIGCGACVSVAPDIFELDDENKAKLTKEELSDEEIKKAKEGIDICPVQAITIEES